MNYFGVKELYDVTLKCTSLMEINGEFYEEGEPLIMFDKLQVAHIGEQKKRTLARGGYGNQTLIKWEDTTGMNIQLNEGIISPMGMSLLSNSQILTKNNQTLFIPYSEKLESKEEEGQYILFLKNSLNTRPYVYRNGKKFTNFSWGNEDSKGKILINGVDDGEEIEPPVYYVYYEYKYSGNADELCIGQRAVRGYLSLTGRMRLKDDQSGKETTCLVEIPKVELMSDLTMRLGNGVSPYIYGFNLQAHPVGERGNQYVCKFTMLDEDIDSDI